MGEKILFVDDEIEVLKLLNRLFVDTSYDVYLANSGQEALDTLSKVKVDLIITDLNMPEMDGYELLIQAKKLYPKMFRVILGTQSEDNRVVKAIQKNLAKLCIYKPWDDQKVMQVVNGIFEFRNNISSPELVNIINNLDGLPTLPNLFNELCEAINDEKSIDDIAEIIEKDQSIATKILHIANSAFYGVKTGSIKQAILNIGLNNIKNIVLATSVFHTNLQADMMSYFKKLWGHAYMCNIFTSLLYEKIYNEKIPVEYLSAGLLHDIGKIVLLNIFGKDYYKLLQEENASEKEKTEIGITHCQMGGYLLNWWELPHQIIESVLYHHDPLNESIISKDLLPIVHLADYYSWESVDMPTHYVLNNEVFSALNIEEDEIEHYIRSLKI